MSTEVTQLEKLARTLRRERYLKWAFIAGIAVLIFLLWRGCDRSKNAQLAYDQIKDTLQKVIAKESAIRSEANDLKDSCAQQELVIADLVADRDLTQGALIDKTAEAERLTIALKQARVNKDTPAFYAHCDSLSVALPIAFKQIKNLREENERIESLRIEQANKLKIERDLWEKSYNECISTVKEVDTLLIQIKPKGRFYFDLTGQIGPVTAAGPGIGYLDKNGRYIGYNYLFSRMGSIHQVRLSAPLSLKRK